MHNMTKEEAIQGEMRAFDHQIQERLDNGHIPDLRHPHRNEWFYNNVWRDPELVKISFLENVNYLNKFLDKGSRILEIGCGPGHNSLELARNGHHVMAVDLSPKCISIAEETLKKNTHTEGFGSLKYRCRNFLEVDFEGVPFDAVFFFGALSHFPDIELVLNKICDLLVPKGKILIYDTGIDVYTEKDAEYLYLIKVLLTATGNFYEKDNIPQAKTEIKKNIETTLADLRYVDDEGSNVQSPNDNTQTYNTMIPALSRKFNTVELLPDSCFYRNIIGGIRAETREKELLIAKMIKLMDSFLTRKEVLSTAFFYYVGTKK